MTAAEELGWEKVADSLHRYAVPGGWLYRVFGASEGTTFVPDPGAHAVAAASQQRADEAWERGHKAGYMQAMSQQGDKVKRCPCPESCEASGDCDRDVEARAKAAANMFVVRNPILHADRYESSADYRDGYEVGLEHGKGDKVKPADAIDAAYREYWTGDKVKPLDTDDLVAVYVPRGITTDDMLNIVKLLYEAEAYAEGSVYAERCCAMAQKLEGK